MARDPIVLERSFQHLRCSLPFGGSERLHFTRITEFIHDLSESRLDSQPYLIDLAPLLAGLAERLDATGMDPRELRAVYDAFSELRRSGCESARIGLDRALQAVARQAVAQLAYAGDLDVIRREIDREEEGRAVEDPLSLLERLAPAAKMDGLAVAADLKAALARWHTHLERQACAVVPVIECSMIDGASVRAAALPRFEIDILGNAPAGTPMHLELICERELLDEFRAVTVQAGRAMLARFLPDVRVRGVEAKLRWHAEASVLRGRSAMLGVGALYACRVLDVSGSRTRYHVRPDAAFSGGLDAQGAVLPVDAGSLPAKVKAAFFSWIRTLAVPVQQVAQSERVVARLKASYPGGRLEIVGVSTLDEVFRDRRLIEGRVVGRAARLGRRAWRRKRGAAAGLAGLAFVTFALVRFAHPMDANPVKGVVAGEHLHAQNADGATLVKIPVARDALQSLFVDVDGDGRNEIFWTESGAGDGTVHAAGQHARSIAWSRSLTFELDFPNRHGAVDFTFQPRELLGGDLDGDGRSEVVVLARGERSFPSLIVRYDAATGEEQGRYLHVGPLFAMRAADLDGDGILEILAAGTNHAYSEACLVVLDPRRLDGHSPLSEEYLANGVHQAAERAYVRIPRTYVGAAVRHFSEGNVATEMEISQDRRLLLVRIDDTVFAETPPLIVPRRSPIYVYFDFDLVPIGVATSNRYDGTARRFFEEGWIDRIPTPSYFQEYMREFHYFAGSEWTSSPAWNAGSGPPEPGERPVLDGPTLSDASLSK